MVGGDPTAPFEFVERASAPARGGWIVGAVDGGSESVETPIADERRGDANVVAGRVGLVDDGRRIVVGDTPVGRERSKRRANVLGHDDGWPPARN